MISFRSADNENRPGNGRLREGDRSRKELKIYGGMDFQIMV